MARQEAAQPPLYYALSALILTPIDASLAQPQLVPNPFVRLGHFDSEININAFAHTPAEAWPWRETSLAVHLIRLFFRSAWCWHLATSSMPAVTCSGPETPIGRCLPSALVGFLPQYVFLHSAVSNDSLIIFLSSAALWQLIRLWLDGATGKRVLAWGLPLDSPCLTKNTGVSLLALVGTAGPVPGLAAARMAPGWQYGGLLLCAGGPPNRGLDVLAQLDALPGCSRGECVY